MKNKKKLTLADLKVKSFVTGLDNVKKSKTIRGGDILFDPITQPGCCGENSCPACIITFECATPGCGTHDCEPEITMP